MLCSGHGSLSVLMGLIVIEESVSNNTKTQSYHVCLKMSRKSYCILIFFSYTTDL